MACERVVSAEQLSSALSEVELRDFVCEARSDSALYVEESWDTARAAAPESG